MIQSVYKFPIISRLTRTFERLETFGSVECRVLTFLLRRDGPISARFVCSDCEEATGRGFETYSFQTHDPFDSQRQWPLQVPEHIVDRMRKHADDHSRIGAVETAGKVLLSKVETATLVRYFRACNFRPAYLNAVLQKLGL